MLKTYKIFISIALMFTFFSCEQHYLYLKKVKSNTSTSKIEERSKHNQITTNVEYQRTFKEQLSDSITIENNTTPKKISSFKILNILVETPKPFAIEKRPIIKKENSKVEEESAKIEQQNHSTNKILLGFLLLLICFIISVFSLSYLMSHDESFNGFVALLLLLGYVGIFIGIILIIVGIIDKIIG